MQCLSIAPIHALLCPASSSEEQLQFYSMPCEREACVQGMRRVLEDKAFIALTRGVWDHVGSRAYDCLQNLASGGENPVRPNLVICCRILSASIKFRNLCATLIPVVSARGRSWCIFITIVSCIEGMIASICLMLEPFLFLCHTKFFTSAW